MVPYIFIEDFEDERNPIGKPSGLGPQPGDSQYHTPERMKLADMLGPGGGQC